MPEFMLRAFRATGDLKFQGITNSGVPAQNVRFIQYKKVS